MYDSAKPLVIVTLLIDLWADSGKADHPVQEDRFQLVPWVVGLRRFHVYVSSSSVERPR